MKRVDVLLAVGSPALLELTEKALLRKGFSVKTETNGVDAVASAFSAKPRCVVCDLFLPGIDGIKVCRFLNSLYSKEEMPVIISIAEESPVVRKKALDASAVAVVDYAATLENLTEFVKNCLSTLPASQIKSWLPLSRDRIVQMVADNLENSLESMETVISLSSELSGSASVPEACRKVVAAVLGGVGFQRVWIGFLDASGKTFNAVAYKGSGLTGEPVHLSSGSVEMPVDVAYRTGTQVASWKLDLDKRDSWVGSLLYVDTPVKVDNRVVGLIRCDNGLSRRIPSAAVMHVLKMLAGELASFVKYLGIQNSLDALKNVLGNVLEIKAARAVVLNSAGVVGEVYGSGKNVPGTKPVKRGMPLKDFWQTLPVAARSIIENAASENRKVVLDSVAVEDSGRFVSFSLSGDLLVESDTTAAENLKKKVEALEFETDAIAVLAADLTSLGDVKEICHTMLRSFEMFYPDEAIAILAAQENTHSVTPERLVAHAVSIGGKRKISSLEGSVVYVADESGGGLVAEAVRTGRILNIVDVLDTGLYRPVYPDIRSELVIPMISRGRVIGVIDLESTKLGRFTSRDVRRLNNIAGFASGVLDTALQQKELVKRAYRDTLTGLHNMTFFKERYPEEFERAERYEYSFSLIMIDIDDFKHYNDSFGHPMGNVFLQKITKTLRSSLRDVDLLVRFGGEEFLCILPLTDKQMAVEIAERIRSNVVKTGGEIENSTSQPMGFVSVSLGVATFPIDSSDKDELLDIADQRMYHAKRAGKNRVGI